MNYVLCNFCGEEYNKKRFDLGYLSCLDCGQRHAQKEKYYKSRCTAPAYNKGAYQYITSASCVKGIFKSGDTK